MRPDYRKSPPRTTIPSKSNYDAAYLWTLSGLALLAACGGGGGGGGSGGSGRQIPDVTNGVTIRDQAQGDAMETVRVDGVEQTSGNSNTNLDQEFQNEILTQPGITSATFDADYDVTIRSGMSHTRTVANAQVPNSVKAQTSAQDDAAWRGYQLVESTPGGAVYGSYYWNMNTGQDELVLEHDIINRLDDGQVIDVNYRLSLDLQTLRVNGQNILTAFFSNAEVVATLRADGFGVSGTTIFRDATFRIVGANDTPVLVAVGTPTPVTDAGPTTPASTMGTFTATDADANEDPAFRVPGARATNEAGFTHQVVHAYGTLYYNATTGAWRFEADGPSLPALTPSDTESASFAVTAWDGTASSNSINLVISVTGRDDPATLTVVGTDTSVREGGLNNAGRDANANGRITVTDPDTGQTGHTVQARGTSASFTDGSNTANSNKGAAIAGTYGTLYLKADYTWTYELHDESMPEGAALQALTSASRVQDMFLVRVDGDATTQTSITINVTGSDETDRPPPTPPPPTRGAINIIYQHNKLIDGLARVGEDDGPTPSDPSPATSGDFFYTDSNGEFLSPLDFFTMPLSIKVGVTSGTTEPAAATSLRTSPRGENPADIEGDYGIFSFESNFGLDWKYSPKTATQDQTAYDTVQALNTGQFLYEKLVVVANNGTEDSAPIEVLVTIVGHTEGTRLPNRAPFWGSSDRSGRTIDFEGTIDNTDTNTLEGGIRIHDDHSRVANMQFAVGTNHGHNEPVYVPHTSLTFGSVPPATVDGEYGRFSLTLDRSNPGGNLLWDYDLDTTDSAVSALYNGQRLWDQLTVHAMDEDGGHVHTNIKVRIDGTGNKPGGVADAPPTLDFRFHRWFAEYPTYEDNNNPTRIDLTAADIDTNVASLGFKYGHTSGTTEPSAPAATRVVSFTLGESSGNATTYGSLSFFIDGTSNFLHDDLQPGDLRADYFVDKDNPTVRALDEGQTLYEKLSFVANDGTSDSHPVTLLIMIRGLDDDVASPNHGTESVGLFDDLDGYFGSSGIDEALMPQDVI